eukprot:TRINITY_DN8453_c0_g2_i3.p1 TRINITY_DN8453_c0_g2~~TRINITY_DN8453_c0_g2_i3.p1  ORF type:complete len:187 (+),score=24.85 TRINITY_DN8453_c0_g2_i3:801-1361(+)
MCHNDDINSVTFSDCSGNVLFTGSDDRVVKVWDRRVGGRGSSSGVACVATLTGHTRGITHVSSKGDGRYLISNSKDQSLGLWDLRCAGRHTNEQKPGLDGRVMTFTGHRIFQSLIRCYFSPEATTAQRFIYSGSSDGRVCIYDVTTGSLVHELKEQRSTVRDVSWHPHMPMVCASSWDGSIVKYEP